MIRALLQKFLTDFSVTPVKGDQTEILTPGIPSGTGPGYGTGLHAQMKSLGDFANHPKYSWPRFPNISSFEIKLGHFNPLLLAFGLSGRLPGHIQTTHNRNGKLNRYLFYMKIQLLKSTSRPAVFWNYSRILVQRSNSYAIGCLHLIDKNAYRTRTAMDLKRILSQLDLIRGRRNGPLHWKMVFHRTYIPKGEASWRPLGVPGIAWRIYLNMLLHPLCMYVTIGDSQHGFRPGRGTLTAWKDILSRVIGSKHIYEFDLKQCFPSISLPRLEHILIEDHHLPTEWARFYISLNYNPPQFRGLIQLDESQSIRLIETMERFVKLNRINKELTVVNYIPQAEELNPKMAVRNSILTGTLAGRKKIMKIFPSFGTPYYSNPMIPKPSYFTSEYLIPLAWTQRPERVKDSTSIPQEILESFIHSISWRLGNLKYNTIAAQIDRSITSWDGMTHEWVKLIGTAQGSPLSPFLAAIALNELEKHLPEGVEILLYADDGLFYGPGLPDWINSGDMVKFMKAFGFTIHPEKSGWVKRWDVWVKDLKFLGLTYVGTQDLLKASTRKGSTLIMNKHDLITAEYDVDEGMKGTESELAGKVVKFEQVAKTYKRLGLFSKSKIAQDLSYYYERLLILRRSLGGISIGKEYFGFNDAFIWYYYILLTRLFYMSRDVLLRTLASGVLSLRDRSSVRSYLVENFTITGLENTPTAPQFDRVALGLTVKGFRRYITKIFTLFGWTEESSVTSVDADPQSPFPWYHYRSLFIVERRNKYLHSYRNKYTWSNFVKSRYAGFIVSRLYNGTYLFDDFLQDFRLTYKPKSLCSRLLRNRALKPQMSVFVGTSFAVRSELRILEGLQHGYKKNQKKSK